MKRILAMAFLMVSVVFTQTQAQEKCLSEIKFQEDAKKDPSLLQARQQLEEFTEQYARERANHQHATEKTGSVVRIIPVVVHVIHYGGTENISDAQILDQIDSLNKDFRLANADTANIPSVFRPLAGDVEIEFRMAQKDPNGNCTDGIVRVFSQLTFGARDNVKSLSYWPSNQYLNIWVVASIANTNGSPGTVIGFAQFPGGNANTDGVVIKHDFMGSIGTAAASGNAGRTATHEIGHWLNLRHIWGDATCGNDFVSDTPTQYEANLSICPNWPYVSSCPGSAPNGDMFTNYMDYTNGDCQNMFSVGQATRMNAALSSSLSGRNNLWSSANLIATGTDGTPAVLCAPKADFNPRTRFVCEGGSLTFNDWSWRGETTSRTWTFAGGTPSTDTSANPTIVYSTPGVYDVTLTCSNAAGSDTKTVTGHVIVHPTGNITTSVPYSEGFEGGTLPTNDWYMFNNNGTTEWEVNNLAASQGSYSINLYNFAGAEKGTDEFITNAFNLSNVSATMMTFDLAYARINTTSSNTDKLVIYFSTNCGATWTPRYTKNGASLETTGGAVNTDFYPTSSDFRTETVSLVPTTISGRPNVRFRFEFTHDTGNNIYIDNINMTGTVGVDEINADNADVSIYPNPTNAAAYVDFNVQVPGKVVIDVMDAQGRVVSTFSDEMPSGDHQYTVSGDLAKGVYFVRLSFGDQSITKKVVIK
jgi:PKD repeat protein